MKKTNVLENALRNSTVKIFGDGSPSFDRSIITCDPNEGLGLDESLIGQSVELSFEPPAAPFGSFSGDVVVYANTNDGYGMLHVFFGGCCSNPELANAQASILDDTMSEYLWRVEDEIDEFLPLHLVAEFKYLDDEDIEASISSLLMELKDECLSDALCKLLQCFEE